MAREMKDSGVEWIGKIPDDWKVVRTKSCYGTHKEIAGELSDNYERLALTLNGVVKRPKDDSNGLQPGAFNGYQVLRNDELVFKLIDLENVQTSRVGYSPYTGIVSPAYIVLYPRNKDESRYGEYFFLSMWQREIFNHMGDDGVRSSLNSSDLLNIPYLSIPVETRCNIAAYLDSQCARIDAIIEKTLASIEELKKLKQATITRAVTKGIRPGRAMKDSGIEWIGEIPEDWEVLRGKNVLSILDRGVRDNDSIITCFRDGEVTLRSNRREDGFTMSDKEIGYQGVDPGDLVVHGMDGAAGAIGISDSRGKASPVLNVLESSQNKRYLMYYLRSAAYSGLFFSLQTGIRIRSCDVNWNKLKNIIFLIPTKSEQHEIAEYLDKKVIEIDNLVVKKERLIGELNDYKKVIIYNFVTGKREVC